MTQDSDWLNVLNSLPKFDPSKCVSIHDMLSQSPSIGRSYSAEYREAAARRLNEVFPEHFDGHPPFLPSRVGLRMARSKVARWLRIKG